jgi:hypothetical protein
MSGSSALSLRKAPSTEGGSIFTSALFNIPTTQSMEIHLILVLKEKKKKIIILIYV